jgi:hypothetical protein
MKNEAIPYINISTGQNSQPNKYNGKEFYIWSSKK